jgi:hypothetical protein
MRLGSMTMTPHGMIPVTPGPLSTPGSSLSGPSGSISLAGGSSNVSGPGGGGEGARATHQRGGRVSYPAFIFGAEAGDLTAPLPLAHPGYAAHAGEGAAAGGAAGGAAAAGEEAEDHGRGGGAARQPYAGAGASAGVSRRGISLSGGGNADVAVAPGGVLVAVDAYGRRSSPSQAGGGGPGAGPAGGVGTSAVVSIYGGAPAGGGADSRNQSPLHTSGGTRGRASLQPGQLQQQHSPGGFPSPSSQGATGSSGGGGGSGSGGRPSMSQAMDGSGAGAGGSNPRSTLAAVAGIGMHINNGIPAALPAAAAGRWLLAATSTRLPPVASAAAGGAPGPAPSPSGSGSAAGGGGQSGLRSANTGVRRAPSAAAEIELAEG